MPEDDKKMNTVGFRKGVIFAFFVLLLCAPMGVAEGQSATQLTIVVTGQTLTAGFNNNVTVTVTNAYFSGSIYPSSAIYNVDIALSLPAPLQISGDNHWHYDSIALKQSVSVSLQVYVPTSAIGNSYQGSVTVNYIDLGDISSTQETREVTFLVRGQNPIHFAVTFSRQTLTAGFNNTVTITATNSDTSQSSSSRNTIHDVDLGVSVPVPLQMFGDNHWHYDSIAPDQSLKVSFQVYAPVAAIGNSYEGSITLSYRQLGDISYTEETHPVTFSVRGWIDLVLYGVQLSPASAPPGGNTTISGNLLNSGNLAAYNANVTIESEALLPGSTTSLLLGEIDPNIPRPFSLLVKFKTNLAEGSYSIVVKVSAIDTNDPAFPYSVQHSSTVQIKKTVIQPPTQSQRGEAGLLGVILEILRYLNGLFFGSQTLSIPFQLPLACFGFTS